jgi:hypothetical protein
MAISGRQWAWFAAGLVLGGAGIALLLGRGDDPRPASPPTATAALGPAPAASASAPPAPAVSAEHRAACDEKPLLRASGASDGQLLVPEETTGKAAEVADKSLVAGKELTAAGRTRDAEVAFLVACRIAADAGRMLTLAEAKYHLGRHYAQVAAEPGAQAQREKLRERAAALYTAAHALFGQQLGTGHEKTRFAANGLQSLATPGAEVVRAPPVTREAAAEPQPAKRKEVVAATPAPPQQPKRTSPSFDCRQARSAAEKAICADEELTQADRALGRLHARAKARAPDAAEFQRRSDQAWRWREDNCGSDRECLRDWYEQRREELAEAEEE